ncbi:MAG: hypothetical protein WCF12_09525 [Propionicimonas sp.]
MTAADKSASELQRRLAALESENAALRQAVTEPAPVRHGGIGRAVVAAILIVLGVLLAPVSVATGWAKATLTDTDSFVATYAPLAHDPEVQQFIVDRTVSAIDEKLNIDGLVSDIISGLTGLGTPPRATAALQSLQGPAAQGIRATITRSVERMVRSDSFATLWAETMRVSHRQTVQLLENNPEALLRAGQDGSIGIQLGPIISTAKERLLAEGFSLASAIPAINRTVVLAQVDAMPAIQAIYATTLTVGLWLPWVVLALLVGGVLLSRSKPRATIWASAGFGLSMLALLIGFGVAKIAMLASIPPTVLPGAVAETLFDTATESMQRTATVAFVAGLAVAVVAWLAGPFHTPRKLRRLYTDAVGHLRGAAAGHGLDTGRVGVWVHRRRTLLLAGIGLAAGLVLVFVRPLTPAGILWTLVIGLLAVVAVTLVERPPESVQATPTPEPAPQGTPEPTVELPDIRL